MNASSSNKVNVTLRIDRSLLEFLKSQAEQTNRSLNNYLNNLLSKLKSEKDSCEYGSCEDVPNEETIAAMEEAKTLGQHGERGYTSVKDLFEALNKD